MWQKILQGGDITLKDPYVFNNGYVKATFWKVEQYSRIFAEITNLSTFGNTYSVDLNLPPEYTIPYSKIVIISDDIQMWNIVMETSGILGYFAHTTHRDIAKAGITATFSFEV